MTDEEIIEVVDHKRRGGRVQSHSYDFSTSERWLTLDSPSWNFGKHHYRIHLEEWNVIEHYNNGGNITYLTPSANGVWKSTNKSKFVNFFSGFNWNDSQILILGED